MNLIPDAGLAPADRAYHDTIAGEYDRVVVQPREHANRRLFARILRGLSGHHALDLGCGTGHLAVRVAANYSHVLGIDHSEAMLAVACTNASSAGLHNTEFRCADVTDALPALPPAQFDLIGAVGFLHHLSPTAFQPVLECCRRALAPGGRIVLVEPLECEEPVAICEWNARVIAGLPAYRAPAPDPDEAPLDEQQLRSAISSAGLEVVREERAWDVLTHDYPPGLVERWRASRLLAGFPGGNVLALVLGART